MRKVGNLLIIISGILLMVLAFAKTDISTGQSFGSAACGLFLVIFGNLMQDE